jgi:hypothetical protein
MKKAVFTVNFGNYDTIKTVPKWDGWDSILVTDLPIEDPRFTKVLYRETNQPELDSRYWKWCSHITLPEYDTVIYYDANLQLIRKPEQDHFHIVHEVRKSVREEIDALIKLNHRWDKESLEKQWKWMIDMGFKDDQGLFLNGFFGRSNRDQKMNRLCEDIWDNCQKWTNRDMLALPFQLYRHGIKLERQVKRSFFSYHVRRPAHKGVHPILSL